MCPDDGHAGDSAVGDPHLGAVDDPVGSVPSGRGLHRARVGSGVGFGEPETADDLAARHRGQPLLLLFLGSEGPDRIHGERALDRNEAAHAGVAGLQLATGQSVADGAGSGGAVAVEVHSEQAHCPHLLGKLHGDGSLGEPVGNIGQHPIGDERAHGVANKTLLVVENGVDLEKVPSVLASRLDPSAHLARLPLPVPCTI